MNKKRRGKWEFILFIGLFIVLIGFLFYFNKIGKIENKDRKEILKSPVEITDFSNLENSGKISLTNLLIRFKNGVSPDSVFGFKGFIVEFKDEPVLVKQKQLKEQKGIRTSQLLSSNDRLTLSLYNQQLKEKQDNFINLIQAKEISLSSLQPSSSRKPLKIMNKFTDVFNGISLDASADLISEIRKMPDVKKIHLNSIVNASLMDTVPLINADDVWQLDEDGNNCATSGNECLTGKGITIGIIDTGVDYTHHDLGGCFGEGCKVEGGWDFVNNDNDPIDDMGHGTHVAATAAGYISVPFSISEDDFWTNYSAAYGYYGRAREQKILYFSTSERDCQLAFFPNRRCLSIENSEILEETSTSVKLDLYVYNYMDIAVDFTSMDMNFINSTFQPKEIREGINFLRAELPSIILEPSQFAHVYIEYILPEERNLIIPGGIAPDATIYAYKVLDNFGSGSIEGILAAIERSVDPNQDEDYSDHIDVISMSLGGSGNPDDAMSLAVNNAVDAGVVVVVAAGNSGLRYFSVGSPGVAQKAVTVGATYKRDYTGTYWQDTDPRKDQITSFSSRGPVVFGGNKPDILAPGAFICSARYDNIYPKGEHPYYSPCIYGKHVTMAGTSMATPVVSGAVALLKQKHPDWTPDEIKFSLKGTALDIGENEFKQGAGRIDILKAISKSNPHPIAYLDSSYGDLILTSSTFDVRGTANGINFKSYSLQYAFGIDSKDWINAIISKTPVREGYLGTIQIPENNAEIIKIRLKVEDIFLQVSYDYLVKIKPKALNNRMKEGFPKQLPKDIFEGNMGGMIVICGVNGIVTADLDKDGKNEIITTNIGFPSKIYVFRENGALWWSKEVESVTCTTPAVGNIDSDNKLEIVYKGTIGYFDSFFGFNNHYVYAWNDDGTIVDGWPIETLNEMAPLDTPLLTDLNKDGVDEIILHRSKMLQAVDGGGNNLWEFDDGDFGFSAVTPIEMDTTQGKLIISYMEGYLFAFDTGGAQKWSVSTDICAPAGGIMYTLSAAKTQGGDSVIAFGRCLFSSDGSILRIFEDPAVSYEYSYSNVFSDIDNDKEPEIIMEGYIDDGLKYPRTISIFEIDGEKIGEYIGDAYYGDYNPIAYQPVISDIGNDGFSDIISFSKSKILSINKKGSLISNFPFLNNIGLIIFGYSSPYPTVYDIDKDGKTELLYIADTEAGTFLFTIKLDDIGGRIDWPMFQQNTKQSGFFERKKIICRQGQIIGDVNDDGFVDGEDWAIALRITAMQIEFPENICCVDANKDGKISIVDSAKIGRVAAGLGPPLGFCPTYAYGYS